MVFNLGRGKNMLLSVIAVIALFLLGKEAMHFNDKPQDPNISCKEFSFKKIETKEEWLAFLDAHFPVGTPKEEIEQCLEHISKEAIENIDEGDEPGISFSYERKNKAFPFDSITTFNAGFTLSEGKLIKISAAVYQTGV